MAGGAVTGKALGIQRVALGVSVRAVARELGISHAALMRWEADLLPLDASRAERWQRAVAAAAIIRAAELARSGFSLSDLAGTDMGRLLSTLATTGSRHTHFINKLG
jgi:hypothetical protein